MSKSTDQTEEEQVDINNYAEQLNKRRIDLTLRNTSHHPWDKLVVWEHAASGSTVELRWVSESPKAGEYLMKLDTLDEDLRTRSNFPWSPVVWLGISDAQIATVKDLVSRWCGEHLESLLARVVAPVRLTVVLGPDMELVTGGLDRSEAFTMPWLDEETRGFRFLVCLTFPQTRRSKEREAAWLRTALTHEFEHVWQVLAINDTKLEKPWRPLAEMCAVYAESLHVPDDALYLEFGADFLRRLACGLLNLASEGGHGPVGNDAGPYWTFPFMEHLEKVAPGIHRTIWTETDMGDSMVISVGPWMALDDFLRKRGTSLQLEWVRFCQSLINPVPGSLAAKIKDRFSSRLPTMRLNLHGKTSDEEELAGWPVWPLSAHWVRVEACPSSCWTLSWAYPEPHPEEIRSLAVFAQRAGGDWIDITLEQTIRIAPGDAPCDLMFVDGEPPDLFLIFEAKRERFFAFPQLLHLRVQRVA